MLIQVINSDADPLNANLPLAEAAPHVSVEPASQQAAKPSARTLKSGFNPASPVPLYSQIRELLRARIADGTYASDGKMPSENEMVRAFGVSRITVRQALNDLFTKASRDAMVHLTK